jgi:hypothetical protein
MRQKLRKIKIRQAANNRLSLLLSKKPKPNQQKIRRARVFDIGLTPKLTVNVSLRRFRVAQENRTKAHSQIVLPIRALGYRQLALTLHTRVKPQKVSNLFDRVRPQQVLFTGIMLIGMAGVSYFGWQINKPFELEPVNASSIPVPVNVDDNSPGLPRSIPTKLIIPKIGLNTGVMKVGLNDDKTIQVPPLFKPVTGWYKFGKAPGEIGPAVIIGHVDTYEGPSVFWRLRELTPGDKITVKRKDGSNVKFKVNKIVQVNKDKFPTKKVYGDTDYPGLRLITCSGTFKSQTLEYTHNTVVFASNIK